MSVSSQKKKKKGGGRGASGSGGGEGRAGEGFGFAFYISRQSKFLDFKHDLESRDKSRWSAGGFMQGCNILLSLLEMSPLIIFGINHQ